MFPAIAWTTLVHGRNRSPTPPRQVIDIADADQFVAEIIAPFLSGKGIVDERFGIRLDVFRFILVPADAFGLMGMKSIVQVQFFPRDLRLPDHEGQILIHLPGSTLTSIRFKAIDRHSKGPASLTVGTLGMEQAEPKTPPALHETILIFFHGHGRDDLVFHA